VGYLLDTIRRNGEKKELVDEVVTLAKRYGITTPYTSYLVVPDAPVAALRGGSGGKSGPAATDRPNALAPGRDGTPALRTAGFARQVQKDKAESGANRGKFAEADLRREPAGDAKGGGAGGEAKATAEAVSKAREQKRAFDEARRMFLMRNLDNVQAGKLGVDLSLETNYLRNQSRLAQTAVRRVQNRNVLEVGGVWIDEGFDAKTPTVTVKAMSPAYFRILERHPAVRDVFRLGNYVVWIAPSGTALVIDTEDGSEQMSDADIDRLFTVKK
jgi:Ca-activated chloride channel family protein